MSSFGNLGAQAANKVTDLMERVREDITSSFSDQSESSDTSLGNPFESLNSSAQKAVDTMEKAAEEASRAISPELQGDNATPEEESEGWWDRIFGGATEGSGNAEEGGSLIEQATEAAADEVENANQQLLNLVNGDENGETQAKFGGIKINGNLGDPQNLLRAGVMISMIQMAIATYTKAVMTIVEIGKEIQAKLFRG